MRRNIAGILMMAGTACLGETPRTNGVPADDSAWTLKRDMMVRQLRDYRITNETVLAAMAKVRRHQFIPESYRALDDAYADGPCPIGYRQTISQPYIVAYMTEKLGLKRGDKVLEIGTGSGYQAAVLAECGVRVYTIEIIPELARHAMRVLEAEGYTGVAVRIGNGALGWPEHAPFDAILLTCAPCDLPQPLKDQLAEGGRLIAPVGVAYQRLVILRKRRGVLEEQEDLPVRFVPMTRPRVSG